MVKPLKIDGTTLEGGGQLVRTALCLSALTDRSIEISSVRGNRGNGGGLKAQHLTVAKWLALFTGAKTSGCELKSKTFRFEPGCNSEPGEKPCPQYSTMLADEPATEVFIDMEGAGSVTLLLQALLPYLLFTPTVPDAKSPQVPYLLTIAGGTNVPLSPSVDYFALVLLPTLSLLFQNLPRITILDTPRHPLTRCWSFSAPGRLTIHFTPLGPNQALQPASAPLRPTFQALNTIHITTLEAVILAPPAYQAHIREALVDLCARTPRLAGVPLSTPSITSDPHNQAHAAAHAQPHRAAQARSTARSPIYILLVATMSNGIRVGGDVLRERKLPDIPSMTMPAQGKRIPTAGKRKPNEAPEVVGTVVETAVRALLEPLEGCRCFDEHLEDQIVVFQALAEGRVVLKREGERDRDRDRDCEREAGMLTGTALETEDGHDFGGTTETPGTRSSLHTQTARWICGELLGVQFGDAGECGGAGYLAGSGGLGRLAVRDKVWDREEQLGVQ